MDLISIILVIFYLMVTGYLGYLGYQRTKTAADYLVAGQTTGPLTPFKLPSSRPLFLQSNTKIGHILSFFPSFRRRDQLQLQLNARIQPEAER